MLDPPAGRDALPAGDDTPPAVDDHALLDGLTGEQAQAARHDRGPLLIYAGPGAGKTRTLIYRIARLLATGAARPWEILAVTFSVRAASELRLRLADLLSEQVAGQVTAATFHSVCARMLREHAHVFGRTGDYTIYDQADVRRVIEWLLSDHQRTDIQRALADQGLPAAAEVATEISLAKNRLLTADSYQQTASHTAADVVAATWRQLDVELQRCNAFDFDSLLVYAVRLLSEHPHRLAFYRQRWRHLLVDEYQDTNEAQGTLLALLGGPDGNVVCVGDDDQALYSFRAAEPRNLLAFGERYPGHATIVLGRNFRSKTEILNAAVACVSHNADRQPKALIAMRGPGGHVQVQAFSDDLEEARWVARQIAGLVAEGVAGEEVLVLARTGYGTGPVQRALAQAGVAHRVLGSLGLYERSEIKDALAYLTLVANPVDAQAFRRAVSSPRRGVGDHTADQILAAARDRHDGDLIAAAADAQNIVGVRSLATREQVTRFGRGLQHVRGELTAGRSIGHVAIATVTIAGGPVVHQQQRRDHSEDPEQRRDAERVLEDLRSLCRAAQTYADRTPDGTLTGFLEQAVGLHAHTIAPGEPDRRITVSTIHRAKGTEASVVVLVACEERLLPSWRSATDQQLAEERRLFYVAATRAKDQLLITHAARRNRRETAGPSRFLTEAGLIEHNPQALAA
jgi:DNA helicase II / ATP-dependent DNA helicase PcrA